MRKIPRLQGFRDRDYTEQWRNHRLWLWASITSPLWLIGLALSIFVPFAHQMNDHEGIAVACSIALPVAAITWKASEFKCPRCGKDFYRRSSWYGGLGYNPFAQRCQNCGFKKWQRKAN